MAATVATGAAAWFAFGAYTAALDAVAEARKQVEAAREANAISARALSAAVGASIHFGAPAMQHAFAPDGTPVVRIATPLTNDGNATTKGLFINLACTNHASEPTDPFAHSALAAFRPRPFTLGPKGTINPFACTYTRKEMEAVAARRAFIAVFGRAWHRDSVELGATRKVEFCFVLHDVAARPGETASSLVRACDKHNCADEDCEAEAR